MDRLVYLNEGISPLGKLLEALHTSRVMLVKGGASYSSMAAKIKPLLQNLTINEFQVSGFGPDVAVIEEAIKEYRSFKPELIIAVGGGKILDTAKALRLLANQEAGVAESIGNIQLTGNEIPLIAIPTTAGTGSEATQFAVIYIDKVKFSLSHPAVRPDYAIVDGSFSDGLSDYDAASSAFDALSQSIEAYWSVNSTAESQEFSKKSIALMLNAIRNVYAGSSDDFSKDMAVGAYYSGCAINISRTTAPHALSYALTSHYGIAHGHAVALMLPMFFSENLNSPNQINDTRDQRYIEKIMSDLFGFLGCDSASDCKLMWKRLMEIAGLEVDVKKLGITKVEDIDKIVGSINTERLLNHPVTMDNKRLVKILRNEFEI